MTLNIEALAWVVVLAVAAGWRLLHLGAMPPVAGEAVAARAAWDFAHGAVPTDWPGDITSALAAVLIRYGSDSIAWARVPSALLGVACVGALALFRPYAGRALPLLGALLLALSPVAIAASRDLSPDTAGLLCGLLLIWLALRVSEDGDARIVPLLGAVAGLALGSGAVASALALVAALWVSLEIAWLDRDAVRTRWREAFRNRHTALVTIVMCVPGATLALVRYGAGPDRLSFAALRGWWATGTATVPVLPWHAPVTLPLLYEPSVLALGAAGFVLLIVQWKRCGAASLSPFDRLLLVWAVGGLALALAALHQRPGQALLFTLSLALLTADLTRRALPSLAHFKPVASGLPLLAIPVIIGFLALQVLSWVQKDNIPRDDAAGALTLAVVCAGLIGVALVLSPRARAGVLVGGVWLLLGWMAPHGAASVALHSGNEPVRAERAVPERAPLVREIESALVHRESVSIERAIADSLVWELRGRNVRVHDGLPPTTDVVVIRARAALFETLVARLRPGFLRRERALAAEEPVKLPGLVLVAPPVAVAERWYPSEWDTLGLLRWIVKRVAWGRVDPLSGEELRHTAP